MLKILDKAKSVFGFKKEKPEYEIVNGELRIRGDSPAESGQKSEESGMERNDQGIVSEKNENSEGAEEVSEKVLSPKNGRLPKIDRFWDFLSVSGRANRTIQEYKYEYAWWTKQAKSLGRTVYVLKISEMEQILKGIHPSTVRRKMSFLRNLGQWYLREGKTRLYMEISKFVSPKIPTRLPGDMGENRFDELEAKAKELCKRKDRLGVWMGLMLVCGLRISEIQTAKVHDERFIKVLGKGNKERKVPALPWVLEAIANIDRDGKKGWAKGRNTIYRHVRKLGIKPHSLRHTYASQLMREGGKIEKIKDCLGHIDISTTNIYARTDVPYEYALLLDRDCRKNRAESVFP